jgi:AraC-like DNA-binding protein
MHQELEIGVVLAGRVRRTTGDVEGEYGPGEVWLCNSCELHDCTFHEVPCSRVTAMIWPPFLSSLRYPEAPSFPWMLPFLAPPQLRPRGGGAICGSIIEAAMHLGAAGAETRDFAPLRARSALTALILTLVRHWNQRAKQSRNVPSSYARIAPAVNLARTERRYVRCQEAAGACGMSVNGLNQQFRKLMGVTFTEYALRYRFGGAARDLVESSEPIKAIAMRWGFTDTSHMHRAFQRFAQCTPGEYRKQHAVLQGLP